MKEAILVLRSALESANKMCANLSFGHAVKSIGREFFFLWGKYHLCGQ